MERALQVGDIVVVKNNGQTYSEYFSFVNTYLFDDKYREMFKVKRAPDNGTIGEILVIEKHMHQDNNVAIIKIPFKNEIYVIGVKGLERI